MPSGSNTGSKSGHQGGCVDRGERVGKTATEMVTGKSHYCFIYWDMLIVMDELLFLGIVSLHRIFENTSFQYVRL